MAGDFADEKVMKFTGAKYYFNSYTKRGRLNWVMATYGAVAVAWMYSKAKKPKTPAVKK